MGFFIIFGSVVAPLGLKKNIGFWILTTIFTKQPFFKTSIQKRMLVFLCLNIFKLRLN